MTDDRAAKVREIIANSTGTENYTRHGLARHIFMTDGVVGVAEAAGAHWFTDIVVSYQPRPEVKAEEFQVWTLTKIKRPDGKTDAAASWRVTMTDGNGGPPTITQDIEYSDFPLDEFTVWLVDYVMLLPGECAPRRGPPPDLRPLHRRYHRHRAWRPLDTQAAQEKGDPQVTLFVVQGSILSTFPIDMLRHDLAYPATQIDSARIMALLSQDPYLKDAAINGRIDITLGAASIRTITPGRWESFGWKVIEIDGDRQ